MMEMITDKDFDEKVRGAEVAVVDFWATWCRPCKAIEPYLLEIAERYAEKGVKVFRINADENPEVPSRFSVFSLPTVLFFKRGSEAARIVGAAARDKYFKVLEEVLEG